MKCKICHEEFGELINSTVHLIKKHPVEFQRLSAASDRGFSQTQQAVDLPEPAEPCPSCDAEFPDFDGTECKCGYRRRSKKSSAKKTPKKK